MEYNQSYSSIKEKEMIQIADALSTASRLDVKAFKKAVEKQGELIQGLKHDFERLIKVYQS